MFIIKLTQNGPLALAGARPGDVVSKFDGVKVETVSALRDEIAKHKVGDTVTITIIRGGAERNLSVTLQEYPRMNE